MQFYFSSTFKSNLNIASLIFGSKFFGKTRIGYVANNKKKLKEDWIEKSKIIVSNVGKQRDRIVIQLVSSIQLLITYSRDSDLR